ncbi:hypothetical protein JCM10212_005349 [Sporobolomyces blumeae]
MPRTKQTAQKTFGLRTNHRYARQPQRVGTAAPLYVRATDEVDLIQDSDDDDNSSSDSSKEIGRSTVEDKGKDRKERKGKATEGSEGAGTGSDKGKEASEEDDVDEETGSEQQGEGEREPVSMEKGNVEASRAKEDDDATVSGHGGRE